MVSTKFSDLMDGVKCMAQKHLMATELIICKLCTGKSGLMANLVSILPSGFLSLALLL